MPNIHAFMFPFRWDYICKDYNRWGQKISKEHTPYSDRTRLSDFHRLFERHNTLQLTPYTLGEDPQKYNEYTYFHAFARKALYYTGSETDHDKNTVLYYELNGGAGDYYEIEVGYHGFAKTYHLQFKSICMHIYNTGVGVLTFNLESNYEAQEDILHINEFGRRMYPQFLGAGEARVAAAQGVFLPQSVEGRIGNLRFKEDFKQYDKQALKPESTFLPPAFIRIVFGYGEQTREGDYGLDFVFRKAHEGKGKIRISLVTDDRMFFMCWYGNNQTASKMKSFISWADDAKGLEKKEYDFWYCFVFGDKKWASIANAKMKYDQLKTHTYSRWGDYGTYFGMTRDSFVCLSNDLQTLQSYGVPDLSQHMRSMYYQMAVLCLVQRASVLRFAYEVSNITSLLNVSGDVNSRIQDLYKNYIEFINKIYFREVTSQLQGIEMYNQFQEVMNLNKEVRDLDGEIQELHNYVSMDEQSRLSHVANWFLPAGAICGLLGIGALKTEDFKLASINLWAWIAIVTAVSVLISSGFSFYLNRRKK